MDTIFRNITAILLSLLIVAGNGGISVFAHTCNQHSHAAFYLDKDDVHCDHDAHCSEKETPSWVHYNTCCQETKCCDTKTIVLKFDQHILKYNSDREQNFKPALAFTNPQLPAATSGQSDHTEFDENNYFREIIPKLNKKKLLRFYTSNKISSDPFPA